jgi:hypothetical protein
MKVTGNRVFLMSSDFFARMADQSVSSERSVAARFQRHGEVPPFSTATSRVKRKNRETAFFDCDWFLARTAG